MSKKIVSDFEYIKDLNIAKETSNNIKLQLDDIHETNPNYYKNDKLECIDAIEASMTKEAFKGFLKGNVLKYLWRYEKKYPNYTIDLEKAAWYLNKLIEVLRTEK